MRKYTGKYPNHIREVYGTYAPGIALVKTNNGGAYYLRAGDMNALMPELGVDIMRYKFTRAQPMTFKQEVNAFSRILDSYSLPFVQYLDRANETRRIEDLEKWCRRAFIHDMAKQGILPRFTDTEQHRPAAQEETVI